MDAQSGHAEGNFCLHFILLYNFCIVVTYQKR